MDQFDFITPFYKQEHSPESLLSGLDSLLTDKDFFVRIVPLGCQRCGFNWLEAASTDNRHIEIVYQNERLAFYSLSYVFREHGQERSGNGHFFLMLHPEFRDVVILSVIDSGVFFHRIIQPLIRSLYPSLLTTFITHRKLRRLLEVFQQSGQFDSLKIKRASQRFRYGSEHHRGSIMPVVSWPDMELAEAFEWVHDNNGWFQSLEFEARRQHRTVATIGLTRQGSLKSNRLLQQAYNYFTLPVSKTIHENLAFFGRRGRRDNPDLNIRPLALTFDSNVFENVAENAKFVESMRSLSDASISVVHGNPYIHMSLIDYLDGSTFDIWAVEENRLVIVPQMKASIPAIKRLINHIFDNYAEGQMADFEACAL